MLNGGATPYVDIWDRKPVGLFLLYSGIRLLGGDGIVQYQIVALLAVVVPSGIMAIWIARFSGWLGAVAGVALYNGLLVSPDRTSTRLNSSHSCANRKQSFA